MKAKRLLITGIPGTGKTTFGNYVRDRYSYEHVNVEELQKSGLPWNFDVLNNDGKVIVTWGFWPQDYPEIETIKKLKERGFVLIWFDGDRSAALKAFNRRGDVPEHLFRAQIKRIDDSDVIRRIEPIV